MTKKTLEQNIKVQLGLLEAKAGKDASISWCKAMVNSRRAPSKVKSLLDSTADPETAIRDLRRRKVETKFYHIRNKILPKQMKKVKIFLTQRVVKKIKKQKEDAKGVETAELLRDLEKELTRVKALDHIKLANWSFNRFVLRDDFLQDKLKNAIGMNLEEVEISEEYEKISSVKCFQDAVKASRSDLVVFLKKLLHEQAEVEKQEVRKEAEFVESKKAKSALSADRSFFMTSLNENEDSADESVMENDSDAYEGRIAFTDDEDGEDGYNFSSDDEEKERPSKKKKNRLGQLARRRLAEKMYGREARHIQGGGLTVQQREALRQQKSQQRREREARIKKDSARSEKMRAAKAADETVKDFKSADAKDKNKAGERNVVAKIDPTLHPSWAAKLKQQQQQQVAFQGQKIKFDD